MTILDWIPRRCAIPAGSGWSEPGPNPTGPLDALTIRHTSAASGSMGTSSPTRKRPGNSGRVRCIFTPCERASGSQGYTSHARSQSKIDSAASRTSLIICSRSFVPWIARLTRSMPSTDQRRAWRSCSARFRSVMSTSTPWSRAGRLSSSITVIWSRSHTTRPSAAIMRYSRSCPRFSGDFSQSRTTDSRCSCSACTRRSRAVASSFSARWRSSSWRARA